MAKYLHRVRVAHLPRGNPDGQRKAKLDVVRQVKLVAVRGLPQMARIPASGLLVVLAKDGERCVSWMLKIRS
jgi:hypothetical protein